MTTPEPAAPPLEIVRAAKTEFFIDTAAMLDALRS
jgi:hypothetical protein